MTQITFGTSLPAVSGIAAAARQVEDFGFDILGCGEHVMFHGPTANTFISLSVAAGATTRLKLLSAIVLLPLYPAALAAKMGAALDVASGGRYLFGVGVGGEFPKEFEACGVPVEERGARTNEALEVITRLWTEPQVSFRGRFTTLNEVSIAPPPVQKPHPPIWVAGRREAAMKRAARYANGWLPYMYTPEQLHDSVETIRGFGREVGRDMSTFTPGVHIFTAVHANGDTARQMVIAQLSKQYAQDFTRLAPRYALAGTPEECQRRLQEYVDAGARTIMLPSACPEEYRDENLRLIAQEVLPAFR
jgi:probable F420-dependent oxidoreductase